MPSKEWVDLMAKVISDRPAPDQEALKNAAHFVNQEEAHKEQDYQDSRAVKAAVEASEAKRRTEDQTRSEHLQDFGFMLVGIGIIYIFVSRFVPMLGMTMGWGLVPVAIGAAYVSLGLVYGELVTWLGYHGQKVVTGLVWTAVAGLIACVIFVLKREYDEAPVGWHGMFFKKFWPEVQAKARAAAAEAGVLK